MNGLDTIIRDNLKWQARALVAVNERSVPGWSARADNILRSSPEPSGVEWDAFLDLYRAALRERRATRGL